VFLKCYSVYDDKIIETIVCVLSVCETSVYSVTSVMLGIVVVFTINNKNVMFLYIFVSI
jgi:hypothetical protein